MDSDSLDLQKCLEETRAFHGELCAGAVLGAKMSIAGCRAVGITNPKGKDRRNLMVYVEIYRCPADAIVATTGCHPGKRTMKMLDYGKMAATFVNLKTGKAVRINAKKKEGPARPPQGEGEMADLASEYAMTPAQDLFEIREVRVELNPEDMPGKPLQIVTCSVCGERVMDRKEVNRDGRVFCKPCADNLSYYSPAEHAPSK